jgi:hypothetical protein
MRRVAVLIAVFMLSAGWLAGVGAPLGIGAQEASPAAEEMGPPEGLTAEFLAYAPIATAIEAPAVAIVERVTIGPGAVIPGDAETSPNLTIISVESGALTFRADAPVAVTRADAIAAAMATPGTLPTTEQTAVDADVTLESGDSAAWPPSVGGELRNDGAEPVVALALNLMPADALTGS